MGERRQMSHAEEFHINHIEIYGVGALTPHSLGMDCTSWFPSKEYSMESGRGSNFTVKEPDRRHACQVVKANINSDKSCW